MTDSGPVEISVVIATYDRPASLERCLRSLRAQRVGRGLETIVVDNHPQSGLTEAMMDRFPEIRWLREPVAGLSRARNRGIQAARGEVIVMTDDDVMAKEDWLERLTAPLFEPEAELVATTGNCLPWKVETEAEAIFEAYGGLRHGEDWVDADAEWMRQWRVCFPQLWRVGTTANAAFRAEVFCRPEVGLFETRLGAGSPAGAWEDLYCFYRILRAGGSIRYLPKAELFHVHREDMDGLRRQLCGYRRGETAFLTLVLLRHGDYRAIGQVLLWLPWWRASLFGGELLRRLRGERQIPLRLMVAEILAYGAGPWSLWCAHRISVGADRAAVARDGVARPEAG